MLRTLSSLFAIRTSSTANRLIYYAQRMPFAGGRIKDSYYANLNGKRVITLFAFLLSVIWGFLSKFAYLGIMVYLPASSLNQGLSEEEQVQLFLHIFLLLSFIVAGVSSATVLEPKREKYIAVKLMRMQPAAYMRTSLGYRYFTYFVYYAPAILVFTSFMNVSALQGLSLTLSVTLWRVVCEYLHLKLFEKTGTVLIKNTLIVWLAIAAGCAIAYAPLLPNGLPTIGQLLLQWPVALVIAVLGLMAAARLRVYSDYRTAVDAATRRDDPLLDIGRMMQDANQKNVKSKESDYDSTNRQTDKYKNLEGYAMLNALFFSRHRSLVTQPVFKRLVIIGALGVIGILFAITDPERSSSLVSKLGVAIPYSILLMNFLSIGERVCRAMFYNCDLSLMRYSFYRSAAGRHFRRRLYRMCGLNLMLAAALGAAVTVIVLIAGGVSVRDLLLTWICLVSLSVFFTVHHLFMYYILQPYSTELNMKNPFFMVINLLVSFVCGISLFIKAPAMLVAIVIVTLTVAYLVAAPILVRKFAYRTFRVK